MPTQPFRTLITGASGFLGRHVVPRLLSNGHEVHAIYVEADPPVSAAVSHQGSLLDEARCRQILEEVRPTHLLHLGWSVPPGRFWSAQENIAWLHASVALFRAFAESGGKRWVGVGSCAEYDWSEGGVYSENASCAPSTLYGACKYSLHMITERLGEQIGVETSTARVFFPYGPGEADGRLVPSVIGSLLRNEPARCTEGLQIRDYIYAEDVADGLVALVESRLRGPVNIGSGIGTAVRELVLQLGEILGRPELIQLGALSTRAGDPEEIVADNTRLRSIGWSARFSLRQGLEKTVQATKTSTVHD